jgi:hypothetical protein
MAKEKDHGRCLVIPQMMMPRETGLKREVNALGVSAMQVKRHVRGAWHSNAMEQIMAVLGIAVER